MKKAIVVGASSGIGRELAVLLVNAGYTVGITGRRLELIAELKSVSPEHFLIKQFDVSRIDTVAQNLAELVQEVGGLDLLILSAGTGDFNSQLDLEIETATVATNVNGFTAVVNWAYKYFEKQKSGHLVAITSIAGLRGSKHAPAYYASKAYQINYLEGLRQKAESSKTKIQITDIRPGLVNTAMAKGDGQFWVADVKVAAQQIYEAIKQKSEMKYVTRRWGLIAMLLKILPGFIYKKL